MFEAYIANGWRNKSAASETSTVIFQWTDADRNSLFRRNTKTWTVADACKPLTSTCKIRSFCTVFWYFYACVPHPMDIFTHSSYILLWHFIWFLLLLLLHFFLVVLRIFCTFGVLSLFVLSYGEHVARFSTVHFSILQWYISSGRSLGLVLFFFQLKQFHEDMKI